MTRRIATRDFPPAVLAAVDRRQGGRYCVDCRELGLVTPAGEPLELDHLQPLSKGGTNDASNLAWKCRAHNRARGNRAGRPREPKWARGPKRSTGR